MNASGAPEGEHLIYLSLGSNISPVENLRKAVGLLQKHTRVLQLSSCWETEAYRVSTVDGVQWPNFINAAALLSTPLTPPALKQQVLRPIEADLGRVRLANKYAPRTIDLDIIIFDHQVIDRELWQRVFLALTLAELIPDICNSDTGESLRSTAERLAKQNFVIHRSDIVLR